MLIKTGGYQTNLTPQVVVVSGFMFNCYGIAPDLSVGLYSRTVTSPRHVRRYMIVPSHGSSRTMSAKHFSAPLRVKYGIAGECCESGPTAYRKNGMMATTRTKAEPDGSAYSLSCCCRLGMFACLSPG